MDIGTWELLSYVVTTIGLPLAIVVFLYEQKRERDNEDEEVYQLVSDNYQDFLKMVLGHPDLHLFAADQTSELNDEQRERKLIIFSMLISLFERAYLLLYEPKMNPQQQRRWLSWEDYMRQWCRREDFRTLLPVLLLAATNYYDRLDPALVRDGRLEQRVIVRAPRTEEEVLAIFLHYLKGEIDPTHLAGIERFAPFVEVTDENRQVLFKVTFGEVVTITSDSDAEKTAD